MREAGKVMCQLISGEFLNKLSSQTDTHTHTHACTHINKHASKYTITHTHTKKKMTNPSGFP